MKRLIIILAAAALLLAILVPRLRKFLLIGGGLVIGVVAMVVLHQSSITRPPSSAGQPAPAAPPPPPPPPKLIPSASIEARDIRTDFPGYGRQISRVTVRLVNNSTRDTLKRAEFRLLIADCKTAGKAAESSDCVTVDDETGFFDYLNVPPRQARDVSLTVKNLSVTILGSPRIDLTVTAALAE